MKLKIDGNNQSRPLSAHLQILEEKETPLTAPGTALLWRDEKLSQSASKTPGFQKDNCIIHISNYSLRMYILAYISAMLTEKAQLRLQMRAVSPQKSRAEGGEFSTSFRWPQCVCPGHDRVWHSVMSIGRASSFELFLQGQYFVHFYLLNFTWLLLDLQGEVSRVKHTVLGSAAQWAIQDGPCDWCLIYYKFPCLLHGIIWPWIHSHFVSYIIPCFSFPLSLSGPCKPLMWPDADKTILDFPFHGTLPFIHSINLYCLSTVCHDMFYEQGLDQ